MILNKLKGVGVALVTPFDEDKRIDFQGLERLLAHTAEGGVDYWVVQGTTGESATLSFEEKLQVLEFVKSHNPKNLPIVYGIGGNNTQAILNTIEKTNLEGVDAILSVSPYYNKPSQEGIYQHYKLIAENSPLPLILYNVPGRTASKINTETTLRLAGYSNIIASKEASNDLYQCMCIAKDKPSDFLLISGDDMMTVPMISVGGQGVISVLANAFPKIFSDMVHSALKADMKTAQENLAQLIEINPLMYQESNPVGVKQVLELLGVCSNQVRLPLLPASNALKMQIQAKMPNILASL